MSVKGYLHFNCAEMTRSTGKSFGVVFMKAKCTQLHQCFITCKLIIKYWQRVLAVIFFLFFSHNRLFIQETKRSSKQLVVLNLACLLTKITYSTRSVALNMGSLDITLTGSTSSRPISWHLTARFFLGTLLSLWRRREMA